jgi:hypothetical protein
MKILLFSSMTFNSSRSRFLYFFTSHPHPHPPREQRITFFSIHSSLFCIYSFFSLRTLHCLFCDIFCNSFFFGFFKLKIPFILNYIFVLKTSILHLLCFQIFRQIEVIVLLSLSISTTISRVQNHVLVFALNFQKRCVVDRVGYS